MPRAWKYFLLLLPLLAQAATPCESLPTLKLPDTTITATVVVAGTPLSTGGRGIANLRDFCRVTGTIKPSPDSDIHFEVWLPAANWNGRFEGIGNGGFAGTISQTALAAAVNRGSATAATDTGHTPKPNVANDASWALGHPEKVIDFGYRAIHLTAENAKALIAAFYGNQPRHSYFDACSNGGRQALMEAQHYPADYDGIVAGAPAYNWTHLLTGGAEIARIQTADPAAYIPPAKVEMLDAAVVAACDAKDGVKDGVLNDPTQCHFDPGTLLCKGADSDACLTAPQVAFVRHVYEGTHDSEGRLVLPGFYPGSESGAEPTTGGWSYWITGLRPGVSQSISFGTQFYSNMVREKVGASPAEWASFQVDEYKAADAKLAATLNASDPDLSKFQARGGKLILYHGWNDPAIPVQGTIDYYRSVAAKMGDAKAARFTRLYLVPGMQHCSGGPGATSFDAMLPQIEKWVESGDAPGTVTATKFKVENGRATTSILRTRPLCPYPQSAQWDGKGNPDNAESFTCK